MSPTWNTLNAATGGLSAPGKMPGPAWSIPAESCGIGSLLRKVAGSPCSSCYALKGRYYYPNVKAALVRRLAVWKADRAQWREAMVASILKQKHKVTHFRWFDSGDIQGPEMLADIIRIARALPDVSFWLPSQEHALVRRASKLPPNLIIRLSSPKVGKALAPGFPSSSVEGEGFKCPASTQDNKCGDCRACWNPKIERISYVKH
jgi:hypothetical protein